MNIACLLPTYGRPGLVRNSIACFLAQTYPAANRRLFILDDGDQIEGQGPGWFIFREAIRYPNMMPKYNRMVELLNYLWPEWEAIALQDDDDVYGPTWLSSHAYTLRRHQWSYPSHVWSLYGCNLIRGDMPIREETGGRFWASSAFRRELFERVGGFGQSRDKSFDTLYLRTLEQYGGKPGNPIDISLVPQYVYGWGRSNHLSTLTGQPHWYERFLKQDSRIPKKAMGPEFDQQTRLLYQRVFYAKPEMPAKPLVGRGEGGDVPRVLILTSALACGGAEDWIKALLKHVPNVEFIGICIPPKFATHADQTELFRQHLPVFTANERPDLIHAANVYLSWGGAVSSIVTPVDRPRIFVSHGEDTRWTREAVQANSMATHWSAVSDVATASLKMENKNPIRIIDNCIDPKELEPRVSSVEARLKMGLPLYSKIVLYVGRNSQEKGPHRFQRMASFLPEGWMGVAIGAGCDQLGKSKNFVGLPFCYNKRLVYGLADVLCSFSTVEGFGLANIEGIWLGIPLVSSHVGVLGMLPEGSIWSKMDVSLPEEDWAKECVQAFDAVEKDNRNGGTRTAVGRAFIERTWSPTLFGQGWSDYINQIVREWWVR